MRSEMRCALHGGRNPVVVQGNRRSVARRAFLATLHGRADICVKAPRNMCW
ncbi:hypothetical protein PSCICO_31460 [Pseudomonas cichorii]|nr:hypothetical protein PSCICO_31460 [Pseudomonas cichorii]